MLSFFPFDRVNIFSWQKFSTATPDMSKALKNVTSKTSQFQQRIPLLQEDVATRLLCFTLLMILDFGGLVGLVGLVPGPPS